MNKDIINLQYIYESNIEKMLFEAPAPENIKYMTISDIMNAVRIDPNWTKMYAPQVEEAMINRFKESGVLKNPTQAPVDYSHLLLMFAAHVKGGRVEPLEEVLLSDPQKMDLYYRGFFQHEEPWHVHDQARKLGIPVPESE